MSSFNSSPRIPFLDLNRLNNRFQEEINCAIKNVLHSSNFILGEQLNLFEKEFAEFNGANFCTGVGSGLDALTFLLLAAGIKKGDEVIVPSHTFIATWLSISNIGAVPVGVEPHEMTYNIDPCKIQEKITTKTKAIVVVNLYGQLANIEPIKDIAKSNNLYLFEDAAQSHGAKYKNKHSIYFSDGIATSFYPGKNLGCMGDGGAVITNNEIFEKKIKLLRNYGSIKKYHHVFEGYNSRLDEIQASILRVKLKYLKNMNKKRIEIAAYYKKHLVKYDLHLPEKHKDSDHVWHLFVIRIEKRQDFINYLQKKGISTLIHYPIPPHKQKCYEGKIKENFPITEKICSQIVSLPIYPDMPKTHQEAVVLNIQKYFSDCNQYK